MKEELKYGFISGFDELDCGTCDKGKKIVPVRQTIAPQPMQNGWKSDQCCDNPNCPSNKKKNRDVTIPYPQIINGMKS